MDHWMHIDIAKLKSMSMMVGLYILDELKSRTTSNGKPFVSGRLSDASGGIDFVMWDNCPLSVEDVGKIIYVDAEVTMYKGGTAGEALYRALGNGGRTRCFGHDGADPDGSH